MRVCSLPLLTLCLFNYCLNSWTCASSWNRSSSSKSHVFTLKLLQRAKGVVKLKPNQKETKTHTGLNRAEVPISQEIEIYFLEHKVHSTSPCGLAPGSVDSAGNRRVSSCTGCEYVGDYLHLPKLQ